ncbi:GNAT family N-acetyltransferase [Kistimonas scapharcae]|uniref:GNAT family N-acetyltransferase n=1 Tax=Kistimonas scapharcae TaxID=1036133 RepID=A0ABP8V3R6_9GAMM
MQLTYSSGTVEEALTVYASTPEFDRVMTQEAFLTKLSCKRHLILIAKDGGQCIGFKVGYENSRYEFYSWLGSVLPTYRGHGIAAKLRDMQEQWALAQGYSSIRVKSCNRYPAMLHLLIRSGYQIVGYEDLGDITHNKIHFIKALTALKTDQALASTRQ